MRDGDEVVEFENVEATKGTEKAILCKGLQGDQELWIPLSQIDKATSEVVKQGDQGTLVISEWIATEKGLV